MKKFVIFATALSLISTTSFSFEHHHPTKVTAGVISGELVKPKGDNIEYIKQEIGKIEDHSDKDIEPGKGKPPQVIYNPEPETELARPTIPVNHQPGKVLEHLNDHPEFEGKVEKAVKSRH